VWVDLSADGDKHPGNAWITTLSVKNKRKKQQQTPEKSAPGLPDALFSGYAWFLNMRGMADAIRWR